jgi:hypothetical protein
MSVKDSKINWFELFALISSAILKPDSACELVAKSKNMAKINLYTEFSISSITTIYIE